MVKAPELKLLLIKWLFENYNVLAIGNEVSYSPSLRRADIVLVSDGFSYAFEVKSDSDNIKRLKEQLDDYIKTFDYTYVVTTQNLLSEVELCTPKKVGIIVCDKKIQIIRKSKLVKTLNKRFLAEFLDRKTLLTKIKTTKLKTKDEIMSVYDLRNLVSESFTIKELRLWAIKTLVDRYSYQSKLFKYDSDISGLTTDDLRTLTGRGVSELR